ncbi:MAG: hypothetical protein INR72_15215 [Williamsia herbipolensis]|nr:hypothetical protein [Williamsia herbipolensis]
MAPGDTKTTDVLFTNIGSGTATKLQLTPGTCTQNPAVGTGTPVNPANLCTNGDLNVNVKCYDGSTVGTGTAYMTYNGAPGAFTTAVSHTGSYATNGTIVCRFVVTMSATASPLDGGVTVSQPLTWELDA